MEKKNFFFSGATRPTREVFAIHLNLYFFFLLRFILIIDDDDHYCKYCTEVVVVVVDLFTFPVNIFFSNWKLIIQANRISKIKKKFSIGAVVCCCSFYFWILYHPVCVYTLCDCVTRYYSFFLWVKQNEMEKNSKKTEIIRKKYWPSSSL